MIEKKKNENYNDYHRVAPIRSIVKDIKKKYDKDPKDWSVIGSTDDQGNYDTFITKKPNAYWLKSKQLSPYSALSIGSKIRNIDKDIDEQIGKKLSPNDMLQFFGMVVPIKQDQSIIASGIEKFSQRHGNHLKKIINERDSNIEHNMAKRIEEEFSKKYPLRKGLYM